MTGAPPPPAEPMPPAGAPRLSVVVPAYEEADRVGHTVSRLRETLAHLGDGGFEVIVVDDGSGDRTADVAREAGADKVVVLPVNRGKGAAVRAGMYAARGRTRSYTDVDLAYAPEQLLDLMAGVEDGYDMVVGSRRHLDTVTLIRARRLREVSGRVFSLLSARLLLGSERDTQCGLKAFSSSAAEAIFPRSLIDGFAFDVELFHIADRQQLRVREIPVTVANSTVSTVSVVADGVRMLRDLVRIRRLARSGAYDAATAPHDTSGRRR